MRTILKCLYFITRSNRFLAGSVIKMMNSQTTLRLSWMINHNKDLQNAINNKTALFGTLDSWLLHRLRQGNNLCLQVEHISDVTSCSATGFFDPFTMRWAEWALSLFSIKFHMLPKVVDNSHSFGSIHEDILGYPIPINCSVRLNFLVPHSLD